MEIDRMWVMVEGPDGAGKSTAARTVAGILSENVGPTVLQKTRAGSELGAYASWPEEWMAGGDGFSVVQDRGAVSAAAYEPVKPHPLHPAIIELIPRIVSSGCVLIHVTATAGVLANRIARRGDNYITTDQLGPIVASYVDALALWEKAGGAVYEFDTSDDWFPTEEELRFALASLAASR